MVSTDSTGQGYRFIDNAQVVAPLVLTTAGTLSTAGIKLADGKPRISSTPYGYDVVEGNISGHTPFFKTGENLDIDTAEEDILAAGGIYVFPATSGIRMEVVSASALDSGTSTGARTVRIGYLDASYNAQSTIVTLNGLTAVETSASNIARINSFRVVTAGTHNSAYGIISLRATADTPIYSQISSNMTRAQNAVYTVPATYTVYITDVSGSITNPSGSRSGTFKLKANWDYLSTDNYGGGDIFWSYYVIGEQDGSFTKSLQIPIKFPEKTDVRFTCAGDAGNADAVVHCAYRGWIE